MTDRAISRKEAAEILGVSETTFRRQEKAQAIPMPKSFKVSQQLSAYLLSDVQEILKLRKSA